MSFHPLAFPLLRRLRAEEFTSGEELAKVFQVSRATVSHALFGIDGVMAVPGKGYALKHPLDWLDRQEVLALMRGSLALDIFDAVDSTSLFISRYLSQNSSFTENLPWPWAVAAEVQTAGKGRRGRTWHAPLGGSILFSLLWRFEAPMASLSGLSLAIGVALVLALESLGASGVFLKWPNDLWGSKDGREGKLGGILVELFGEAMGPVWGVLGVGINCSLKEKDLSAISGAAFDLSSLGVSACRASVLAAMLDALLLALPRFEKEGFSPFRGDWIKRHLWQEKTVEVIESSGGSFFGVARGVDETGALLVIAQGKERRLSTGEVSLRR